MSYQTDYDYCADQRTARNMAERDEPVTEVQLISLIIDNLPGLTREGAKRVLDYVQRVFDDHFGKNKVMR